MSRSVGFSFAFSSVASPGDLLSGGSLPLDLGFPSAGLVHLTSLLRPSIVSGTSSTAWIARSATSSARVSGFAPILRSCFPRSSVSSRSTFGASTAQNSLGRAEQHHLLNHTPRFNLMTLQLHSTSGHVISFPLQSSSAQAYIVPGSSKYAKNGLTPAAPTRYQTNRLSLSVDNMLDVCMS